MIDLIGILGALWHGILAVLAFSVLLVLPGVRLADRLVDDGRAFAPRLVLSFVISQVILAVAGLVLVALGLFSGLALAVVAVVCSIAGLPVAWRWLRGSAPQLTLVAWAAALSLPWVAMLGRAGWPPADTLQWYYAGLGQQLAGAGGIPRSVAEWGLSVRWLPDYLVFNLDSEAYLAVLSFLPRADALAAWRVPVAILGIVLVFFVVRLWVGRPAAFLGTALIVGTAFFLAKFDAYKPEALGIALGLAGLWLVVRGLRTGRRAWVLLGGASLGIVLSVHAIAATVIGLFVAAFAAAEWVAARDRRRERAVWLVRAALLGLLISVVMGIGLQGRAVVAGGALNPGSAGAGAGATTSDPTWTFFLRSTGNFDVPEPAPPARPLAGGVTSPWAGIRITSALGWWLIPFAAIGGLFFAGLGGRRARAGVVGLAGATALLAVGIGFFALAFETYVPRWTGLVRFGQYLPFLVGVGLTFGLAGYLRLWSWLADVRIPRAFALVAAVVGAVWLVPLAGARFAAEPTIQPDGRAALETLRTVGANDDVVLSNALTTGTIEWFSGLEAPLEGRQPLIEDPGFLATANQLLLDAHDWFASPKDRAFLDRLGVRWVLVADDPALLGATATLGGSVSSVEAGDGLRVVWSAPGVALLEVADPASSAAVTDDLRPKADLPRVLLVWLLGLAAGIVLVVPLRRLIPGRRRRDSA